MCGRVNDVRFRKCLIMQANNEVISFKDRMQNLGLKEMVMAEIKRPVYPREVKGRSYAKRKKF